MVFVTLMLLLVLFVIRPAGPCPVWLWWVMIFWSISLISLRPEAFGLSVFLLCPYSSLYDWKLTSLTSVFPKPSYHFYFATTFSLYLLTHLACSGAVNFQSPFFRRCYLLLFSLTSFFPWPLRSRLVQVLLVFRVRLFVFHPLIQLSSISLRLVHVMTLRVSSRCRTTRGLCRLCITIMPGIMQ